MIRRGRKLGVWRCAAGLLACFSLFTEGCTDEKRARAETYQMGDRVVLRPFTYNVIELQWKSQLGDMPKLRLPEHRFLLIRLSVTNGGGQEASVPLLTLEDTRGNSYRESANGEAVENWFGLLRTISPAGTDQGWLLFDVPIGTYRLRLTNAADPEQEAHSFVDLPLSLDPDNVLPK